MPLEEFRTKTFEIISFEGFQFFMFLYTTEHVFLSIFSQNKLDEALLTSGRVADALSSMLEWLSKVQTSLAEEQPILGDLDTVSMLIEQHKVSP